MRPNSSPQLSPAPNSRLQLDCGSVRAGKQLEPAAACALVKDETVHVIDGLGGGAPILRRREVAPASGAALPAAPSVAFYQGGAHGGRRLAELTILIV